MPVIGDSIKLYVHHDNSIIYDVAQLQSGVVFFEVKTAINDVAACIIDAEGVLRRLSDDPYRATGTFLVRGFGMTFVPNDNKYPPMRVDPSDAVQIFNRNLRGHRITEYTRASFEGSALVFDNRLIVRSIDLSTWSEK